MRTIMIISCFYLAFLFPGLLYPHQTQSQIQKENKKQNDEMKSGDCTLNLDSLKKNWNSGHLDDRIRYWDFFTMGGWRNCINKIPLDTMLAIIGKPDYNGEYYYMEHLFDKNHQYCGCYLQLMKVNDSFYYFRGECH